MFIGKKLYEKKLNNVKLNYEYYKDDKEKEETLDYINMHEGDPLSCMYFLGKEYETKASLDLLFDKNIYNFRKNIYINSKLYILSRKERTIFSFGYNIENIFEILCSNNQELLKFIVDNLEMVAYEKKDEKIKRDNGYCFLVKTMLLALRGDFEAVKDRCNRYLSNPLNYPEYKYKEYDFEFLLALANKDIEVMKEKINKMLEVKVAKTVLNDISVFFDFYLHLYVIIYVKIALYNGIDLEIDDEIAPKELIDNTPLLEYPEPFDFMREFDFSKITLEEWREWIYRYHPNPEELEETEKKGYIV